MTSSLKLTDEDAQAMISLGEKIEGLIRSSKAETKPTSVAQSDSTAITRSAEDKSACAHRCKDKTRCAHACCKIGKGKTSQRIKKDLLQNGMERNCGALEPSQRLKTFCNSENVASASCAAGATQEPYIIREMRSDSPDMQMIDLLDSPSGRDKTGTNLNIQLVRFNSFSPSGDRVEHGRTTHDMPPRVKEFSAAMQRSVLGTEIQQSTCATEDGAKLKDLPVIKKSRSSTHTVSPSRSVPELGYCPSDITGITASPLSGNDFEAYCANIVRMPASLTGINTNGKRPTVRGSSPGMHKWMRRDASPSPRYRTEFGSPGDSIHEPDQHIFRLKQFTSDDDILTGFPFLGDSFTLGNTEDEQGQKITEGSLESTRSHLSDKDAGNHGDLPGNGNMEERAIALPSLGAGSHSFASLFTRDAW